MYIVHDQVTCPRRGSSDRVVRYCIDKDAMHGGAEVIAGNRIIAGSLQVDVVVEVLDRQAIYDAVAGGDGEAVKTRAPRGAVERNQPNGVVGGHAVGRDGMRVGA
ncbi:MAG TPA: hypothetical protein VGX70_09010 [Gemmataceae bacterium]|nr:hypothetical protein [Gemmataceae bacterium]